MLLSEQELRAALEPLLDRLLIERLRYFQLQLEPKLQASLASTLAEHGIGKATTDRAADQFRAGVEEILCAKDMQAVFGALFEASANLVGKARALLVSRRGQTLAWKSASIDLPERFPTADAGKVLRADGLAATNQRGDVLPITVRGVIVGWLYWERTTPLPKDGRVGVEMLLHMAGLALLGIALTESDRPSATSAANQRRTANAPEASVRAPRTARTASSPEEARAIAFAILLIEDLGLYLQRERSVDLDHARRKEAVATRFEAEIGRCRRAYFERFPGEDSIWSEIFEEAVTRL